MSEFKIQQRDGEGFDVIDLHGYLDAHTAPQLETIFERMLNEKKYNIVVNCKNLNYISSAGLGVFMAYIEDVRKNKGDIKLSNMTPKIFDIFDLLGFPLIYEIFDEEKQAISKFIDADKKK